MERRVLSPDSALASDIFDQFCNASTLKSILGLYRRLTDTIHLRPTNFPHFYPKLKGKLRSWKAQALWTKFDKRASHKCYARGHACADARVLIIGAGPCGLRAAVEAQLLGAKVVVIEKRDRISRNNVLHLWPFVIHDLRALGAKKFFGKFCAGAIDHISIRQLQVILLKVALLLGVEVHIGVSFEGLVPPPEDQHSRVGWRADVLPADHAVNQYEFDVLIGADGKRNTLEGFGRKEFRGKLAIAITANFLNRRTEAEARVEEISGVAFIFNQKFFKDLYQATGIDLENIVYYKDDTHYFVMTAKKHSLLDKGVIISDQADTARLLSPDNVNREALMEYAHEAADFSTKYELPALEFAVNHYGQPDVAMFDFTSMYAAENATRVVERKGHRLLTQLVGDSLLEPFWPTGSGCARGFLSSMDACWALRSWCNGIATPLEVAAERESIYRLLAQTTPENLSKDFNSYTLEPQTRYPNLNLRSVLPIQTKNLIDTDNPDTLQILPTAEFVPSKRRRKDSQVHPDILLLWLKRQVALYDTVKVDNVTSSFRDGMALGAIVHHYRSDLVDFNKLKPEHALENNKMLFELLHKEYAISPVMSASSLASAETIDELSMLTYLSQVYDAFRGEIPHLKSNTIEEVDEVVLVPPPRRFPVLRTTNPPPPKNKRETTSRTPRKRRSHDKDVLESLRRREQLEADKEERAHRRRMLRHASTQSFVRSVQMLQASSRNEPEQKFEDPDLAVYRQYAPQFSTRVKHLEEKFTYQPERESRELSDKKGVSAENFSGRVKELEAKFKGTAPAEKKPRDLLRSIGKIERSDWNMAVIERKIEENRMGRNKARGAERVPKWSREKFADKFSAVERKLRAKSSKEDATKFADIDDTLKRLDRKIREGSTLDTAGIRGANKVSAMAEQLVTKLQEPALLEQIHKSNSKSSVVVLPSSQSSDNCHFCGKRVYLMERLSAETKFFHRGCFRCEYCGTSLRPNNYAFDRDGKFGSRFVCTQHFGTYGFSKGARARRKSEDLRAVAAAEASSAGLPSTPKLLAAEDVSDRGAQQTPERVEFENLDQEDLSSCEVASSSHHHAEMDEDAWTDHNFGASCADDDDSSEGDRTESTSDSSDDDAEAYEDAALGEPLSVEETRQLAETWQRRYSGRSVVPCITVEGSEISDNDQSSDGGDWSCDRDEIEDEDSSTATEGDAVARELLRQEERLRERALRRRRRSQDSDTEVASDCTSTETDSEEEEEEEEENLATEIETDSEFELDSSLPPPATEVRVVQVLARNKHVRGNLRGAPPSKVLPPQPPRTKPPPSKPPLEMTQAVLRHRPTGLDLKQKELTHSTEGIASKMSLELKKRYLLGGDTLAFNKNVQKSGSASALDSKFRSFVDQISEQQKLLQPAASPSPSPFVSPAPLLTSMSSGNIFNRSDVANKLPKVPFVHVCGKNNQPPPPQIKITPDEEATPIVENKQFTKQEETTNFENNYSPESDKILDLQKEKEDLTPNAEDLDPDYRPRSPAHETSIIVPDKSEWQGVAQEKKSSESSSETESESEYDDSVEETPNRVVPRLEITNSEGVNQNDVSPDKEAVCDTELSDWAQDVEEENSAVDFDEFQSVVDTKNVTFRKQKHLATEDGLSEIEKNVPKVDIMIVSDMKIADTRSVGSTFEDIDFMDSEEDEELQEEEATNVPVIVAYQQLNEDLECVVVAADDSSTTDSVSKSSDNFGTTPDTELENLVLVEAINAKLAKTSDEESLLLVDTDTTLSDATTLVFVVDANQNNGLSPTNRPLIDPGYEAHVKRLQGRISPFSNAKDSIDIRKSRKSSTTSSSSPSHSIKEEPKIIPDSTPSNNNTPKKEELISPKIVPNTPSTSRKLEELSRERSKQKDLIAEMVMGKLGSNSLERKRSQSSGPRKRLGSRSPTRSLIGGPPPVPATAPPKLKLEDMENVMPKYSSRRPFSVYASSKEPPSDDTRFSCPDIRRALFVEETSRDKLREQARAKARLLTDQELGLSPENNLSALRDRARRTPVAPPRTKKKSADEETKTEPLMVVTKRTSSGKKPKDRERRRSLIQAMSEFFTRKSSPSSPTKGKSTKDDETLMMPPPPLPPPPAGYSLGNEVDEMSPSEGEEDSSSRLASNSSLRRSSRSAKRHARQAQLKRLRMAHELQRLLEQLEVKQKMLEERGVTLEKALRGEEDATGSEVALLQEWFQLMRERSDLRRYERELGIRAQELELQERHAKLQADLRERMAQDDSRKSSAEVAEEGRILSEMLEIVEKRDSLIALLEEDRQRYMDEDKDIESQMLAKGLRLTPLLRKESNV